MVVSYSSLQRFLSCQRKYQLSQIVEVPSSDAQEMGKNFHSAFERYGLKGEMDKEFATQLNEISILKPELFKLNGNEIPLACPLPSDDWLVGVLDGIVILNGEVWLVEIKTTSQFRASTQAVEFDLQKNIYGCMVRRVFGCFPVGILYVSVKLGPVSPPKELADGSLSRDKAQKISLYDLYAQLDQRGENPQKYIELIENLRSSNPIVKIVESYYNKRILAQTWKDVKQILGQMKRTKRKSNYYRNPTPATLGGCYCEYRSWCYATDLEPTRDHKLPNIFYDRPLNTVQGLNSQIMVKVEDIK